MSRIYYRGGMSPFETFSPGYILTHNVIGTNVGNFLYLNGVLRSLMIDDNTVIQANYYNTNYYKPEYVNENFDCFVIPLADAFRENFVNELNELTSFVKKLKIPCYVIGVGLKESYEPDFSQPKPQDEAVKKFVTAVLEKSNCIGVRGELTGKYLDFKAFDRSKLDEYSRQAKELYGNTPEYKEMEEKQKNRTEEDEKILADRFMLFFKEAGEMKNMNPASDDAQNLVRRLQDYITQNLYTCTNKILRGLGKMYSGGGDFTTNIDAYGGEGTAIFVADAIEIYCDNAE